MSEYIIPAAAAIIVAIIEAVAARDRRLSKQEKEEARKREDAREELELNLVEGMNAALALSEATAKAVQRIPDANCNGDMHAALAYAEEVKHKQRDFLAKQGIRAIVA